MKDQPFVKTISLFLHGYLYTYFSLCWCLQVAHTPVYSVPTISVYMKVTSVMMSMIVPMERMKRIVVNIFMWQFVSFSKLVVFLQ